MKHDEVKELLAPYALGSATPAERGEVDRHLSTCAECSDEVAAHVAVVGTLAHAIDPVEPAPDFTAKVLAAARGDQEAAGVAPPRRWRRLGLAAGLVVVVAIAVVASVVAESRQDSQRREDVLSLLASGEGISLHGDGDVIGRVAGTEFAIAGIGTAPEGKTYQLWLMRGDGCPSADPSECELTSAGTFDTKDGVALMELDEAAGRWEDAAVTIEDDDGATLPTTEPFLRSYDA